MSKFVEIDRPDRRRRASEILTALAGTVKSGRALRFDASKELGGWYSPLKARGYKLHVQREDDGSQTAWCERNGAGR